MIDALNNVRLNLFLIHVSLVVFDFHLLVIIEANFWYAIVVAHPILPVTENTNMYRTHVPLSPFAHRFSFSPFHASGQYLLGWLLVGYTICQSGECPW